MRTALGGFGKVAGAAMDVQLSFATETRRGEQIANGQGVYSQPYASVKCMDVGQDHAGERWTDVLGWSQGEVTIGEDGKAEFKCPARSVSIWVHESARGREEFGKK